MSIVSFDLDLTVTHTLARNTLSSIIPSHTLTNSVYPVLLPSSFNQVIFSHNTRLMGTHHHRRRRRLRLSSACVTVAIAFLLLESLSGTLCVSPSRQLSVPTRMRLGGPGSSPPTCRSKCGWCAPCEPVHVPVQPGFSMPLEYYPEAWRCKCGDKLFMP